MQALLQDQKIDEQISSGDAASLTDAVRLAASAKDGPRALTAFDRLRSQQPSDPFVSGEGPRLVAMAFINDARLLCQQGKVADAANIAAQGASALSGDTRLGNAAQRYQVATAILAARGQPLDDPDYDDLHARYANAAQADPDGMQQLEHDLGDSMTLPQGSLSGLLDQIRTQSRNEAGNAASDAVGAAGPTDPNDAAGATASGASNE
jgi:non-specific serine/threonine protein kinase